MVEAEALPRAAEAGGTNEALADELEQVRRERSPAASAGRELPRARRARTPRPTTAARSSSAALVRLRAGRAGSRAAPRRRAARRPSALGPRSSTYAKSCSAKSGLPAVDRRRCAQRARPSARRLAGQAETSARRVLLGQGLEHERSSVQPGRSSSSSGRATQTDEDRPRWPAPRAARPGRAASAPPSARPRTRAAAGARGRAPRRAGGRPRDPRRRAPLPSARPTSSSTRCATSARSSSSSREDSARSPICSTISPQRQVRRALAVGDAAADEHRRVSLDGAR